MYVVLLVVAGYAMLNIVHGGHGAAAHVFVVSNDVILNELKWRGLFSCCRFRHVILRDQKNPGGRF
jgi:hypothetical protein